MTVTSTGELVFYAIVNYLPFFILAIYPFREVFRFSFRATAILSSIYTVIVIGIFLFGYYNGSGVHTLCSYGITLLSLFAYFLLVKARFGRMLFNLFILKNAANFVVVISKFLESLIWGNSARVMYQWTSSLCMLIVLAFIIPLFVYLMNHYFSKEIRDSINLYIWNYLWLIPVLFYLIWLFIFNFVSEASSLELALRPSICVFMLIFEAGQLLVYVSIAQLVLSFNKTALLEADNQQLASQALQYRTIQNRIKEITVLKHDIRHHLLILSGYAEHQEYELLTSYLQEYIDTIPSSKIVYCSNPTLNMLLVYYKQKCEQEHIRFDITMNIPEDILLSDSEITVLFGNLLENASDACKDVAQNRRFISFKAKCMHNQLIFLMDNSCTNTLVRDDYGTLLSTKHSGYGLGTQSSRNIVKKYNGTATASLIDHIFTATIIIPLKKQL